MLHHCRATACVFAVCCSGLVTHFCTGSAATCLYTDYVLPPFACTMPRTVLLHTCVFVCHTPFLLLYAAVRWILFSTGPLLTYCTPWCHSFPTCRRFNLPADASDNPTCHLLHSLNLLCLPAAHYYIHHRPMILPVYTFFTIFFFCQLVGWTFLPSLWNCLPLLLRFRSRILPRIAAPLRLRARTTAHHDTHVCLCRCTFLRFCCLLDNTLPALIPLYTPRLRTHTRCILPGFTHVTYLFKFCSLRTTTIYVLSVHSSHIHADTTLYLLLTYDPFTATILPRFFTPAFTTYLYIPATFPTPHHTTCNTHLLGQNLSISFCMHISCSYIPPRDQHHYQSFFFL